MSETRTLVSGQSSSEPGEVINGWITEALGSSTANLCVYRGMSLSDPSLIPNDSRVTVKSTGLLGTNRDLWERGQLTIIPVRVSEVPAQFADKTIPVDVLAVRAVKCKGGYTPGIVSDYIPAALAMAHDVIVQVDDSIPVLPGAPVIPDDQITSISQADSPGIPTLAIGKSDPAGELIASWVASIIRDGDNVQLGLGTLGPQIAKELARQRKHLGVHTGLLDDAVMDLLDSGAVDNSRKAQDRGWTVTPIVMGTTHLYGRVASRSDILLRVVEETNNPAFIAQNDNFVAVNSALEVDLTGQVNAECIHGRRLSTTGGQLDYVMGSTLSSGGRSMTVLPSTANNRQVSRIVPSLLSGSVTVPSSLVDYVVTEHGIADLRGKSLEQRARAIISVADPMFRDWLEDSLEGDARMRSVKTVTNDEDIDQRRRHAQ